MTSKVPLAGVIGQPAGHRKSPRLHGWWLARYGLRGHYVPLEIAEADLAEVLRAQAADVREAGKRRLLEAGGRKEIAMMVPVVFLVLPVTVLFALFPGLISIVSLAQ